jgi:hypothetical protein
MYFVKKLENVEKVMMQYRGHQNVLSVGRIDFGKQKWRAGFKKSRLKLTL